MQPCRFRSRKEHVIYVDSNSIAIVVEVTPIHRNYSFYSHLLHCLLLWDITNTQKINHSYVAREIFFTLK